MSRRLIYSMTVSLDGFIADRSGNIDWTTPDEELFAFHTEETRKLGAHLCGRRLYETMVYWETAPEDPDASELTLEFADIWQRLPKLVFSSTLEHVVGNTRLATGSVAEEVARLKGQPGKDFSVGGAGLAASCMEVDLIDEFRLFVSPVILGGGTPYFAPVKARLELELIETRTFPSRVVYLRYRRVSES